MKTSTPLLLLAVAALLSGCATMSESECKTADWGRRGYDDGNRGESHNRIATYAEDCKAAGVRPDAGRYRHGWDQGIKNFCTPAGGWRAGSAGQSGKAEVCRGQPFEPQFSRAYEAGLELHRIRERMRRNAEDIQRTEARLDKATTEPERRQLRERLRELDRDRAQLRRQEDWQARQRPQ